MERKIKTERSKQDTPIVLTKDMRATLKNIIAKELEFLPETISKFEPAKRIEIILKLLPFVLPKVESVSMQSGETSIFGFLGE